MPIQLLAAVAMLLAAATVVVRSRSKVDARAGVALRRGLVAPAKGDAILAPPVAPRPAPPVVQHLAAVSARLTPTSMSDALQSKLLAADLGGTWSNDRLLAAKLLLGVAGTLLGLLRVVSVPSPLSVLMAAILAFGCWYLPDFLASQRADARRALITRELPDTMDQLTIAVEAGLGFEAALARVAKQGTGPLAAELRRTLQDIQLGMDRADALDSLGARTDITDLRRFVAATRQAERYGLPIAAVLRTQSRELRDRRRQRAEEHAMKIPVKVLFPLVFCILPTLFIVILAPGIINFTHAGGLGG